MKWLLTIIPAAVLLIMLAPSSVEAKTFENDKYTFEYPSGCKLETSENRFSTADATLECKGEAGFLFESGEESTSSWSDLSDDKMVSLLEETLGNIHYGSTVVESGTDKYMINNYSAPYVIGTYDQEFHNLFGTTKTEEWALMMIVIRLDNGEHMMVQYRNNEDDFDKQLPMAEKIIYSVKGLGNGIKTDNSFTSQVDDLSSTKAVCDTVTTQSGKDLCDTLLN